MWQSPEAFKQRVREWAEKIGVEVQTISLRAMKNKVPNHGKLWKSLMRAHLGDYERQEERLKQVAPRVKGEW